ncbi:Vitamin B12 transporter BtuB precursor [compost metagenome]
MYSKYTFYSIGNIIRSLKAYNLNKVIGLLLLTILSSSNIFAQTDTSKNNSQMLKEVTVNSQRKKIYSAPGRVISVITANEIKNMPVHTVQDLLESVSSVDIRTRGENGVQADVSIRGGSFDQVLILLNGINVTDPQTGHHNLNLPVNLDDIDRIEILQGPGTRILGPNAFTGAVNIVTGEKKTKKLQASLAGGENGYLLGSVSALYHKKELSIGSSANYSRSDGYIHNTDFNLGNYFLQMQYENAKAGKVNFQGGFQNKSFGANSFYSPAFKEQYEHTRTIFSSLQWNKNYEKLIVDASFYWRRNYDRYELIKNSSFGRNFHRTDVLGGQAKLSYFSQIGKTTVGVDYSNQQIVSTVLGVTLNNPSEVDFGSDISPIPQYVKGDNRNVLNTFIDHTIIVGALSLSGGLLNSWNEDYGSHWQGGADASYRITSDWQAFAGINQSMRLPTFTDLYYRGPDYAANNNLVPETALSYEAGVKYDRSKFGGSLSVYQRNGKDIIDWIKPPDSVKWQSSNISKVNTTGLELSVNYKPATSFIKRAQFELTWQKTDKDTKNYTSMYDLSFLRFKSEFILDHAIVKNLIASWRISYQQRAGNYKDFNTKAVVDYNPFTLLDLRLMYTLSNYAVFVESSNLFNTTYYDFGNLQQPGRWMKAGVKFRL